MLKFDPDWNALPAATPSNIRKLLRQCLTKERKQRLQAIGDARLAIDDPAEIVAPTQSAPPRTVIWKALAGVLAVALAAVSLLHFRETPPESRLRKSSILPPDKTTFDTLAVSPDGRLLAFAATDSSGKVQLWVRPLDSLTAQPLAGADEALYPFWSPDSRFIGFFVGGRLKKIWASGGPAQTICAAQGGRGGTWNRDGDIVFGTTSGPLFRVPAAGGEAKALSSGGESAGDSHRWPSFLPDGRHFLYWARSAKKGGIYLGSLDSKDRTRLLGDSSNAVYAEGYLLFARSGSLMAQRFETGKLQLVGEPFPVAEQVGYFASTNRATHSASENGVLVYDSSNTSTSSQLIWFDRTGKRLGTEGEPCFHLRPQISLDEKKMVVDRIDPQTATYNLWIMEQAHGISSRFSFGPGIDWYPVWSPDGSRICFLLQPGG